MTAGGYARSTRPLGRIDEGVVLGSRVHDVAVHLQAANGHFDHVPSDAVAILALVNEPQSDKISLALIGSPTVSSTLNCILQSGGRASTVRQNASKTVKTRALLLWFIVAIPREE